MPGMQRFQLGLALSVVLVAPCLAVAQQPEAVPPKPPVAAKKPHETKMHGDTRVDNYFWLRDRKNPEVLAHLDAEDAYTEAMMKGTEALQQKLYDELLSHVKQTDLALPVRRG